MIGPVIAVAGVAAVIGGVIAWAMAWRYGRRRALVVPVLAVAAAVVMVLRGDGQDPSVLMGRLAIAASFAGPAVAGALIGIALAARKAG
jgi:predicted MFS family arabinose efflux permease